MTSHHYDGRDLEVLAGDMPRYYCWIMSYFQPYLRGTIVEYGAGIGTVSRLVRPLVERLSLVEPSVHLAERLKEDFKADAAVEVFATPLESHVAGLDAASVDGFVLVNVLEHIEEDRSAMAEMHRALRPGGHVLLFVPALSWLMSDLDRIHGHFRRYHRKPLVEAMNNAGFQVKVVRYMDLPGAAAWWLLNTIGGAVSFNPHLVAIYDRWVVPLARMVESRFSPPLGKNILVVARRVESES